MSVSLLNTWCINIIFSFTGSNNGYNNRVDETKLFIKQMIILILSWREALGGLNESVNRFDTVANKFDSE